MKSRPVEKGGPKAAKLKFRLVEEGRPKAANLES